MDNLVEEITSIIVESDEEIKDFPEQSTFASVDMSVIHNDDKKKKVK